MLIDLTGWMNAPTFKLNVQNVLKNNNELDDGLYAYVKQVGCYVFPLQWTSLTPPVRQQGPSPRLCHFPLVQWPSWRCLHGCSCQRDTNQRRLWPTSFSRFHMPFTFDSSSRPGVLSAPLLGSLLLMRWGASLNYRYFAGLFWTEVKLYLPSSFITACHHPLVIIALFWPSRLAIALASTTFSTDKARVCRGSDCFLQSFNATGLKTALLILLLTRTVDSCSHPCYEGVNSASSMTNGDMCSDTTMTPTMFTCSAPDACSSCMLVSRAKAPVISSYF